MICDEYKQRARISLYQRSRVFNVVQPLHDNDSERTRVAKKKKKTKEVAKDTRAEMAGGCDGLNEQNQVYK